MNRKISFIVGLLLIAGVGITGLTDNQSNEQRPQLSLNDAIRNSFQSIDFRPDDTLKWFDLESLGEVFDINKDIAQIKLSIPGNDLGSEPRTITLSATDGSILAFEGENPYPIHQELLTNEFEITFRDFEGSDVSRYTSDQFYRELAQARESIDDSHQELSEGGNH